MTLDAFATPPASALKGPRCTVGRLAADPPPALARLGEVLDVDSGWSSAQIAAVLAEHGHNVRGITVARHRRRAAGNGCACP